MHVQCSCRVEVGYWSRLIDCGTLVSVSGQYKYFKHSCRVEEAYRSRQLAVWLTKSFWPVRVIAVRLPHDFIAWQLGYTYRLRGRSLLVFCQEGRFHGLWQAKRTDWNCKALMQPAQEAAHSVTHCQLSIVRGCRQRQGSLTLDDECR